MKRNTKPKIFISHITEEKDLAQSLKSYLNKKFQSSIERFVSSDSGGVVCVEPAQNSVSYPASQQSLSDAPCSAASSSMSRIRHLRRVVLPRSQLRIQYPFQCCSSSCRMLFAVQRCLRRSRIRHLRCVVRPCSRRAPLLAASRFPKVTRAKSLSTNC